MDVTGKGPGQNLIKLRQCFLYFIQDNLIVPCSLPTYDMPIQYTYFFLRTNI
jgi:hypothetical protein